jgi:hypothetical protein
MTTLEMKRTLSMETMERLAFWSLLPIGALLLMVPTAMTHFPSETTQLLAMGLAGAGALNVALTLSKSLARFVCAQSASNSAEIAETASCTFLKQMFLTFLAATVLAAVVSHGQIELLACPFWLMIASCSIIVGITSALIPFRKQQNHK